MAEIGGNLKQPGFEGRLAQRPDLLPGAQERLLRDVGGILGRADHPKRHVVERNLILHDQLGKRLPIAPAGQTHQVAIVH